METDEKSSGVSLGTDTQISLVSRFVKAFRDNVDQSRILSRLARLYKLTKDLEDNEEPKQVGDQGTQKGISKMQDRGKRDD